MATTKSQFKESRAASPYDYVIIERDKHFFGNGDTTWNNKNWPQYLKTGNGD